MAQCDTCGREYLDSYPECPFCARQEAALQAFETSRESKRPPRVGFWLGIATGLAVLAAGLFWVSYGVGAVKVNSDYAFKVKCYSQQVQLERSALIYREQHDGQPPATLADLVPGTIPYALTCPNGGSYTLSWDSRTDTPKVVCSKHGWHSDPQSAFKQ